MSSKKEFPDNIRTMMGFFMTPFSVTMGTMGISMYSMFLTDFAGLDTALGKTGFAAAFATVFLIITRIIDAVDDPLQGWLLDSAKERKFGKYRRFGLIGTLMITVGTVMLFGLPGFAKKNVFLLWIWVLAGYLILETGSAMGNVTTPLMQKATTSPKTRSKITSFTRMGSVVSAIPFLFYIPMITLLGKASGNLGKTASVVTVFFSLAFCGITVLGIMLMHEPYREYVNKEYNQKISLKEIWELLKMNKPLWFHCIGFFIGGLATGSSPLYFIRWKFCADMVTGEVDLVKFAAYSGILSVITLIPNFLCPLLMPAAIKLFKSPDKCIRACYIMVAASFGMIFLSNSLGFLTPALLFIFYFLGMLPNGMIAMLTIMLVTECADYAEYNLGRNMTALVNSLYNLTVKASSVIGTAIPGILLAVIGYSVNEQTGAYVGNLSNLPHMVNGLGMLLGPVPVCYAVIAFLVYKFGYKITPEYRQKMSDELNRRHTQQNSEINETDKMGGE